MLKDDELIGKFIKYSPEISEEIYNKILKRFKELGFLKWTNSDSFDNFKMIGILNITKGGDYFIPSNTKNTEPTEISYKDIIGEEEWWRNLKKGDYVVCIDENCSGGIKNNYIFKTNHGNIKEEGLITDINDEVNGYSGMNEEKFRIATPEEIKMFIHAGNKPVDVTTYKIPKYKKSNPVKLIPGEFYVSNYPLQGDYIFIATDSLMNCTYLRPDDKAFYKNSGNISQGNGFKEYRYATTEEKQWLNICYQENKFIPKEDVAKYLKPKFEVGKWYKGQENNYYIKFSNVIKNGSYNFIYYSEKIYSKEYKLENGYWANNEFEKYALENPVDINEIQQYLPESHVDKIKSFTVHNKCNIGDIIVSLEPESVDTPRKNGDLLKVLDYSDNYQLRYSNGWIQNYNVHTYRLATPQEVEMYNNDIKNIYDKVEKEEFQKGDWVSFYSELYKKTYTSKIKTWGPSSYCVLENEEEPFKHLLRKATEEEIQSVTKKEEYKVGDWVLTGNGAWSWESSREICNKILQITRIDMTDSRKEGGRYYFGEERTCGQEIVRKATPEEIKAQGYPEQKETKYFNDLSQHIGRYIKALVDRPNKGGVKKGEIGIIVDIYSVDFPSHKKYACSWALRKECEHLYELMPESYVPEVISSPEEKDLITIAKERYPIGTKFHPVNTTTGNINENEKPHTVNTVPQLVESGDKKVICANGNLYYNGIWATIVSTPQEKIEYNSTDFLTPPKTESWNWTIIDMSAKPELILKEDDEMMIFPNIKKERIVKIKIKLVD